MKYLTTRVDVPEASYDVLVGSDLLSDAGSLVRQAMTGTQIAIVTDDVVAAHYGMALDTSLARAGFTVESFTVPSGEASKSWHMAGELLEAFAERGLDRTATVVALGGGVVGDLAGFVASVYLRGIGFAQVPTTLLAMVDSSVGGKTGVDLRAGKNLAGAFKQPSIVLADTALLGTLPEGEWRSGCAEIAKSAVLSGEAFLTWLEEHAGALVARDPATVAEAVRRCVEFKAGVVARDEREEGPRECLNYGHTLGHALEKVLGYGSVTHGAAVAEGMRFAARLSVETAGAEVGFAKRQDRLLDALGLEPLPRRAEPRVLLDTMRGDKKSRAGVVRMVMPRAPGEWECGPVADPVVQAHLEAWASTKEGIQS